MGQNKHALEEHQALWLNGWVLNLILKYCRFEPHRMQGVLALSKTLYHLFSTGSTEKSSQQDRKNLIKQTDFVCLRQLYDVDKLYYYLAPTSVCTRETIGLPSICLFVCLSVRLMKTGHRATQKLDETWCVIRWKCIGYERHFIQPSPAMAHMMEIVKMSLSTEISR